MSTCFGISNLKSLKKSDKGAQECRDKDERRSYKLERIILEF